MQMFKVSVGSALSLMGLLLSAAGKAEAATFTFTKIADTNTSIPEGPGNFITFSPPVIDDGNVAFVGFGSSEQQGIYTNIDSSLNVVADTNTPIPGGAGNFINFLFPSLDNGNVAFTGEGSSRQFGIYTDIGGLLNVVADTSTPVPGGTGTFLSFGTLPLLDNGNVAFRGSSVFEPQGIYTDTGGSLNVVAGTRTPIPGGTGNFISLLNLSFDEGNVAFAGIGSGFQSGIYTDIGGSLNVLVDTNTALPGGGTVNLGDPIGPVLDGRDIAFGNTDPRGIYTIIEDSLNVVADTNTAIPGGTENFDSFGNLSFDNGNVAFVGADSYDLSVEPREQLGIYTNFGGSLTKVIDLNDSLDGKTLSDFAFTNQALSGNKIAFLANFTDGSHAIYVATANDEPTPIPEPTFALGVLTFGAFAARSAFKRKHRKAAHLI